MGISATAFARYPRSSPTHLQDWQGSFKHRSVTRHLDVRVDHLPTHPIVCRISLPPLHSTRLPPKALTHHGEDRRLTPVQIILPPSIRQEPIRLDQVHKVDEQVLGVCIQLTSQQTCGQIIISDFSYRREGRFGHRRSYLRGSNTSPSNRSPGTDCP
jgi:hypothetical protein